jgi:hypothetical protein
MLMLMLMLMLFPPLPRSGMLRSLRLFSAHGDDKAVTVDDALQHLRGDAGAEGGDGDSQSTDSSNGADFPPRISTSDEDDRLDSGGGGGRAAFRAASTMSRCA